MSRDNILAVVQFIHPGKEQNESVAGWRFWNIATKKGAGWPHRRKFMIVEADYIDRGTLRNGLIGFWGEWEPPSKVIKAIQSQGNEPAYFHAPAYYEPESSEDHLDTDPFVFGNRMLYNGCQQHTHHHRPGGALDTKLRWLDRGSVILFGSSLGGQFILDTVFVVGDFVDYPRGDYEGLKGLGIPDEYWHISLYPQELGNQTVDSFRLYLGATYHDRVNGMFSFTPCQPMGQLRKGFERPVIEVANLVTQILTQGKKINSMASLDDASKVWQAVRDQVTNCGCALAHHIPFQPVKVNRPCKPLTK